MKLLHIVLCAFSLLIISCNAFQGDDDNQDIQASEVPAKDKPTEVKVLEVRTADFNRELIANGKLEAVRKANLSFKGPGIIQSVNVSEGMRVVKGKVLAVLDRQEQRRAYKQADLNHSKALLDYQDQLLRAGYQLDDTLNLDPEIKRIAQLRSGLSSSVYELEKLQEEINQGQLIAPFPGQIANVQAKAHNQSSAYNYICTLIDDSSLEVEFQVLEQELNFVRHSKIVRVQPFSDAHAQTYRGHIVSVNPLVNQDGMITVRARVENSNAQLMDGMSVRVIVQQAMPEQLVIPKEAVLDRQDRKVVFTLEDGLAKWNYVEIAAENSVQYAISKGLDAGDKVIYEGNFNLAHDKPVRVIR